MLSVLPPGVHPHSSRPPSLACPPGHLRALTFKRPLGGPRWSCHSGASPSKNERVRDRRGNQKVQRCNAFLLVCRRKAGRTALIVQAPSPPPALPRGHGAPCSLTSSSCFPFPLCQHCSSASQVPCPAKARSAGMRVWKLTCTQTRVGKLWKET